MVSVTNEAAAVAVAGTDGAGVSGLTGKDGAGVAGLAGKDGAGVAGLAGRRAWRPIAAMIAAVIVPIMAAGCAAGGIGPVGGTSAAGGPRAAGGADGAGGQRKPGLTVAKRRALARAYLAAAVPANHRLEIAVDGFARSWRRDPAAADAFLRAQTAAERWFDRRLSEIPFPPALAAVARALVAVNQHRIALTELESRSVTVAQLRSFGSGHRAADAAVEAKVRSIRRLLGLPPPANS